MNLGITTLSREILSLESLSRNELFCGRHKYGYSIHGTNINRIVPVYCDRETDRSAEYPESDKHIFGYQIEV